MKCDQGYVTTMVTKRVKKKATSKSYTVVKQLWEESERGWGTRPDGHTLHLTLEDRNAYVKAYYAKFNSARVVPNDYTRIACEPKAVTVDEKTYKALKKSVQLGVNCEWKDGW